MTADQTTRLMAIIVILIIAGLALANHINADGWHKAGTCEQMNDYVECF